MTVGYIVARKMRTIELHKSIADNLAVKQAGK
jgi:hypothetical protein